VAVRKLTLVAGPARVGMYQRWGVSIFRTVKGELQKATLWDEVDVPDGCHAVCEGEAMATWFVFAMRELAEEWMAEKNKEAE
jgi:hypothetical protein